MERLVDLNKRGGIIGDIEQNRECHVGDLNHFVFYRLFFTGPASEQLASRLVNVLVVSAILVQALNVYLFKDTDQLTITVICQIFGILTIFFMWRTQFRDPGILDPSLEYTKTKIQMQFMSFDPEDMHEYNDDQLYQRSDIYTGRYCSTCHLTRPPKSSHCRTCNNCVRGFDHHCTFLNNCIGRRNYRSFVLFLLTSVGFGVLAIIQAFVLIGTYQYRQGINRDFIILLCSHLVFIGCILVALKPIFRNNMRLAILVGGVVIGATNLFIFQKPHLIPCNILLLAAALYVLGINPMVLQYITLVGQGLTYKEFLSRMSASQTFNIEDKRKHLSRKQKLDNFVKFMFKKRSCDEEERHHPHAHHEYSQNGPYQPQGYSYDGFSHSETVYSTPMPGLFLSSEEVVQQEPYSPYSQNTVETQSHSNTQQMKEELDRKQWTEIEITEKISVKQ
eukprot:403340954